ncbi:hypothetical protein SSABA_v1c03920 [Spiroplasma sabaudiense Ar-1343]|uniref:Uncharacterized protein n=1 Tax=Spiroplasma sabaudiense Ar-1343 TaxID=1276257 RepID=W6A9Z1_9MOLU|nr:hypothetical protein [Spiroplasma sabaudiense]AHI53801.1 hypothetical protein SSABA_v1c03920 [Spiroplasma sabaudiense Ar-1343]
MKNKYSNKISQATNSATKIGRYATDEEIKKFSYLVPNYEWFTKLESMQSFGYTDAENLKGESGIGLCEYVSLAMLIKYQELFYNYGYFTDKEYDNYFELQKNNSREINMPIHKYYEFNDKSDSFVARLWELNNRKIDLWWGVNVDDTLRKWIKGKEIKKRIAIKSCLSIGHTSQPEAKMMKHNVPVMLSFVAYGLAHNVVIYGYDKKTKSYLVHFGWSSDWRKRNCAVIIEKSKVWHYYSRGFWNAFYPKTSKKIIAPKPRFEYDGKMHTWDEIKKKGLSFKDVKPY